MNGPSTMCSPIYVLALTCGRLHREDHCGRAADVPSDESHQLDQEHGLSRAGISALISRLWTAACRAAGTVAPIARGSQVTRRCGYGRRKTTRKDCARVRAGGGSPATSDPSEADRAYLSTTPRALGAILKTWRRWRCGLSQDFSRRLRVGTATILPARCGGASRSWGRSLAWH